MNKKVVIIITLLVVIIALVIAGTSVLRKTQKVLLQGEIAVTEIKISSKLAGRVEGLVVKEGDKVQKGDFLFSISTPSIDAKLVQAQAAKSVAEAQMEKVQAGTRKEILQSAYNLMNQAQVVAKYAKKSFARIDNLYKEGVVPEQKYDEVKMELDVAIERERIASDQYNLALNGAQKEDKESAKALVQGAEGAVEEVESFLSDASQYAPFSGVVSSIISQNGELASAGYPIITMIDLSAVWVSFNVKETLLPEIKKGEIIEVYVLAIDKNIEIKIHSISVQADYATWESTNSRGGFDIRTFEVKAYPITSDDVLRPGMTVLYELKGDASKGGN